MMYNIKTGWGGIRKRENDEIVILVSSLPLLISNDVPFLFTDRHAYLAAAQFYSAVERLDQIDWDMLQRRDFKNDPDDPSKKERYQAEVLVHKHMPAKSLFGFACYNDACVQTVNEAVASRKQTIQVIKQSDWYF